MENIIVVFSSRNHTMQFASFLRKSGIPCKTVNTPRELSVACGISVVVPSTYLNKLRMILKSYKLSSFLQMYVIVSNGVFKKYRAIT